LTTTVIATDSRCLQLRRFTEIHKYKVLFCFIFQDLIYFCTFQQCRERKFLSQQDLLLPYARGIVVHSYLWDNKLRKDGKSRTQVVYL
jgi:hypothetical protein